MTGTEALSKIQAELGERFTSKIELPDDLSECWLWTGHLGKKGYGYYRLGPRKPHAHRVAYAAVYGDPGPEMHAAHLCADERAAVGDADGAWLCRSCVNPTHLQAMTPQANTLASALTIAAKHAARNACPSGHSLDDPANLRPDKPCRICLKCSREAAQRSGRERMAIARSLGITERQWYALTPEQRAEHREAWRA